MDRRILTLAGVVLLIAGIIFFMKFSNKAECIVPHISIDPARTVAARQTVSFSYAEVKADDQAHWIFSDGKEEDGASITRYFQAPGTFTVQLIVNGNDKCSATDSVIITEPVEDTVKPVVAKYSIICPDVLYVGVQYQFKAVGDGGKTFQWEFGESGNYEPKSNTATCTYKYSTPSPYTITLHVDDNISATKTVTVKIKSTPQVIDDPHPHKKELGADAAAKVVDLINQFCYAAKNNDEDLQSTTRAQLLMKLCGSETTPVEMPDGSLQSFEKYLQSVSMHSHCKDLKSVQLDSDNNGCITKIKITE